MGHYDEFYEAEAERHHQERVAADERALEGTVESIEFLGDEAVVRIRVPYYSEARRERILSLLHGVRVQVLKEHSRRNKLRATPERAE